MEKTDLEMTSVEDSEEIEDNGSSEEEEVKTLQKLVAVVPSTFE